MAGMSVTKLVGVVRESLENRASRQAVVKSGAASRKYVRKFRNKAFIDPRLDMYLRVASATGVVVVGFGRLLSSVDVWRASVRDQCEYAYGSLTAFTRTSAVVPHTSLYGWVVGDHCPRLSQALKVTVALGHSLCARSGSSSGSNGGARIEKLFSTKTG